MFSLSLQSLHMACWMAVHSLFWQMHALVCTSGEQRWARMCSGQCVLVSVCFTQDVPWLIRAVLELCSGWYDLVL